MMRMDKVIIADTYLVMKVQQHLESNAHFTEIN